MTSTVDGGGSAPDVVDDPTYDLLQALTSKLETIEAYQHYLLNDERSLFIEILGDEQRHARLLIEALRDRL